MYIEWPIAANETDIKKLVEEAEKSGSKALVGLQGRWAAPVLKLRELVDGGRIGKILSVDVKVYGGTIDREILPIGLKYFAERKVGGNPITIGFGHGELPSCRDFGNVGADNSIGSLRFCAVGGRRTGS